MDRGSDPADRRASDAADRSRDGRGGGPGRAAVAAAGAERLARHGIGVDRRRATSARHCQRIRRTGAGHRSACAPGNKSWSPRLVRNAIDRRARRDTQPSLGASCHDAGISAEMTMPLHAPSRRALLLASGTLFAWAHLPKLAHAEGRDPRMLTIILRGALDGLATVMPVGDPDWVKLRGEKALTLDGI